MKTIHSICRVFLLAAFSLISINGETPRTGGLERQQSAVVVSSISGRITNASGDVAVNNVTVTLTGTTTATATTGNGFYNFFNLPDGGTYTVTPSSPDYVFTPPSRTFTNHNGNPSNVNFTATPICSTPRCRVNGKIAYVQGGNIYTASQNGFSPVLLTSGGLPSFSPNGDKIVFVRDAEIYTINTDGGNITRLTTNSANDSSPSFSPDGNKIIFVSGGEIYTMNAADGSNVVRLTNDTLPADSPKFSPDGRKIVFVRTPVGQQGSSLFTMNADGSNQVQITTPGSATDQSPSFSPDGSRIMFTRFDFGSFLSPVLLVSPDGSNLGGIGTSYGRNYTPAFSPDGKSIIVRVLPDGFTTYFLRTVSLVNGSVGNVVTNENSNSPAWQPLRPLRPEFDFDGNLSADISVFRPSNGSWYFQQANNSYSEAQFGANGDLIVPADYDGDRRTDLAVFRRGDNSTWYILQSTDNSLRAVQFGASNAEQPILFDTPVPADYDGDLKADLAVWRLTDNLNEPARFLILESARLSLRDAQWGNSSDRPVPADYDGDERADLAVYRGGVWYILNSNDNSLRAVQFGISTDKTVPADYDGDGRADLAVYRPSAGDWYIIKSGSSSFTGLHFGVAEDKPTPADYDGDGKTDLAVFRPSEGNWYLLRTNAGFAGFHFGTSSDLPTPNAYVR